MNARALARVTVAISSLAACDNSQAIHEPDLGWQRMLEQPRGDPYAATSAFPDGRVMRTPPEGTMPHSVPPIIDPAKEPPAVTRPLLEKGRARFDIFCAACHGYLGDGVSVVATKMEIRKPPSLLEARILAYPPLRLYTVVTKGYGLMSSYAIELTAEDRWAVAFYVKALQASQTARVAELPPEIRRALEKEAK